MIFVNQLFDINAAQHKLLSIDGGKSWFSRHAVVAHIRSLPTLANSAMTLLDRNTISSQLPVPAFFWFGMKCVNIHTGKKYGMVDCTKEKNFPYNVVFPSQFARLLIEYQEHPEAKSLAPDGGPCVAETRGLLKRAHIVAGEFRYVGKETDRKWEEGDEISVLEFATTEYGRKRNVIASDEVRTLIQEIGINKCARESGFDRKNFIRKLARDIPVKRNSYNEFLRWLQTYKTNRDEANEASARNHYESTR